MSHYSIADQTLIDDYYFKNEQNQEEVSKMTREEKVQRLKLKVDHLKHEYGLLGIIDIVLNHTAGNSEWLLEHPEAAYNTKDCPHLMSAYVLDRTVADFSADYANKR
jgi:glycogen debranching enzyme